MDKSRATEAKLAQIERMRQEDDEKKKRAEEARRLRLEKRRDERQRRIQKKIDDKNRRLEEVRNRIDGVKEEREQLNMERGGLRNTVGENSALIEKLDKYQLFVRKVQTVFTSPLCPCVEFNGRSKTEGKKSMKERIDECALVCEMWKPKEVDCSGFNGMYGKYKAAKCDESKGVDTTQVFTEQGKYEPLLKDLFEKAESSEVPSSEEHK